MEVKYVLTTKEREFLIALKTTKRYYPNSISGAMMDDQFRKDWVEEITSFRNNKLLNPVKVCDDCYWRYELSSDGLKIQVDIINEVTTID